MSVAPASAPIWTGRIDFHSAPVGWPHPAMTETSTPPTSANRRPSNDELRALVDDNGAAIYRVGNDEVSGTIVQLHATTAQLQLDDGSFLQLPYGSLFGRPFTVTAPPPQG